MCVKYAPNGDPTSVGADLELYECIPPDGKGKCQTNVDAKGSPIWTICSNSQYTASTPAECTDNCPCGYDWKKFEDRCGRWADNKCKKKKKKRGKCTKKIMRRCGSTCYPEVKRFLDCKGKKNKDKKGGSCASG